MSGAIFCMVSALAYTAVNISMRQLTTMGCDPIWAVFNRELVSALVVSPWLVFQSIRGEQALPSGRVLFDILLVGLLIQLGGNIGLQWALGIVGLAIVIPSLYGFMITSAAVLGRLLLQERLSYRGVCAIVLLLAGIVFLSLSAETSERAAVAASISAGPWILAACVGAAGLAGGVFAVMNIVIRRNVTRTTRPSAIAFLVPLMGVVGLGPICLGRFGIQPWIETPWEQFGLMAGAGVFNLVGFLALIHGLQRITVVHVNILNASQVAMAAVAGMVLFREPPTAWLFLGVFLTIAGIFWFDRREEAGIV